MIPIPITTHAIAAAVAAWPRGPCRVGAWIPPWLTLRNSHTQAQAELTARNAKHLVRVWERGDELATSLNIQQSHITKLHQEHTREINRLTTGRACLSAELVGVLNRTQPATTDGSDAMPTPTGSPASADAGAFATDADVGNWTASARHQYAECAARLGSLIEWHTK
jgi:hypothetical protein